MLVSSSSSRSLPTVFASVMRQTASNGSLVFTASRCEARVRLPRRDDRQNQCGSKKFFQALKQKIFDDAVSYEAHRAALNEEMFELEMKLASQHGGAVDP